MKNKIEDLRNHLFEALERLNDDEIMTGPNRDNEIKRATAIAQITDVIVRSAKVEVDFMKASKRLTVSEFIKPSDETLKVEAPKEPESVSYSY